MNDTDYFYTDTLRSRMKEFIGLKNKYPYKINLKKKETLNIT